MPIIYFLQSVQVLVENKCYCLTKYNQKERRKEYVNDTQIRRGGTQKVPKNKILKPEKKIFLKNKHYFYLAKQSFQEYV